MPTYDNANANSSGAAATLTVSLTIGGGSNRAVYAAVHAGEETFTATFNGTSMTELYDGNPGSPFKFIAVYRILEANLPAAGTYNVIFTPSASVAMAGCAIAYSDVDQGTPNDTIDLATATSQTPSNAVTSESGDLVIDFVVANLDTTATATQTARVNHANGDQFVAIYASEAAGAASVTMGWTLSISTAWTSAGLNLNAASPPAGDISAQPGEPLVFRSTF